MQNSNIVEVRSLKKIYTQGKITVTALDGIDLDIEKGEFTALAGPSGSGKTTLLNLIGGLDRYEAGTIALQGKKLSDLTDAQITEMRLQSIGFIFQAYNLIPVLSAVENVEYVMLLQGVPEGERRQRAASILDEVGLQGMHHRRPAELSGGQQQRVAVARAIVSGPSIVLADEPTANLDSKTAEDLLDIMFEMNQSKEVTFLFSTHDELVMKHARRIVHLRDGQVSDDDCKN